MCHDGQGCWYHWTTRIKLIIWERVYNTLISLMPYENIIFIVLSPYLNIELAFIPDIKFSLATFASSCQINSICKQQVRSKSVFPALLHMYKCNARRETIIFHREAVCSGIWFRITWLSWFRSSSISFLLTCFHAFAFDFDVYLLTLMSANMHILACSKTDGFSVLQSDRC